MKRRYPNECSCFTILFQLSEVVDFKLVRSIRLLEGLFLVIHFDDKNLLLVECRENGAELSLELNL
jgi:hypothetical protein